MPSARFQELKQTHDDWAQLVRSLLHAQILASKDGANSIAKFDSCRLVGTLKPIHERFDRLDERSLTCEIGEKARNFLSGVHCLKRGKARIKLPALLCLMRAIRRAIAHANQRTMRLNTRSRTIFPSPTTADALRYFYLARHGAPHPEFASTRQRVKIRFAEPNAEIAIQSPHPEKPSRWNPSFFQFRAAVNILLHFVLDCMLRAFYICSHPRS